MRINKDLTPKTIGINAETPQDCKSLEDVRQAIDTIDRQIIHLLALRLGYVLRAARFKPSEQSIPAPKRVQAMLIDRQQWSEKENLDPDFIVPLFSHIIQWFIQQQIRFWKHNHSNAPTEQTQEARDLETSELT